MIPLIDAIAACPDARDAYTDALDDLAKAQLNYEAALEGLSDSAGGWDAFFGLLGVGAATVVAFATCLNPDPTVSKKLCYGSIGVVGTGIGLIVADEIGDAAAVGQAIATAELLRDEAKEELKDAQETFFTCVKFKLAD